MSTRCEVMIKQTLGKQIQTVRLYHHHDGYPEGVGADLVKRSKKWYWHINEITNELIKDSREEYEFTATKHVDIEYFYLINCDSKKITCFRAEYKYNEKTDTCLLKTLGEEKI